MWALGPEPLSTYPSNLSGLFAKTLFIIYIYVMLIKFQLNNVFFQGIVVRKAFKWVF